MINDIISMNGYGIYVWSAFAFTLISFAVLYTVIKVQLVKEKIKFDAKYLTLTSDKKQAVRAQETYREILASNSVSKI
ncbi:MAG: heme exporter protein CcmD [Pelagibacterales bacterium]|nr:heme exporter protein CcmD [Pelagibacterales bacterium]